MPPHSMLEWMVGQNIPRQKGKTRNRDVLRVELSTDDESGVESVAVTYPRRKSTVRVRSVPSSGTTSKKVRFAESPRKKVAPNKARLSFSLSSSPSSSFSSISSSSSVRSTTILRISRVRRVNSADESSSGPETTSGYETSSEQGTDAKSNEQELSPTGRAKKSSKNKVEQSKGSEKKKSSLKKTQKQDSSAEEGQSTDAEDDSEPDPKCPCSDCIEKRKKLKHAAKEKNKKQQKRDGKAKGTAKNTVLENKSQRKVKRSKADRDDSAEGATDDGTAVEDADEAKTAKSKKQQKREAKQKEQAKQDKENQAEKGKKNKESDKEKSAQTDGKTGGASSTKNDGYPAPFPPSEMRQPNLIMPVRAQVLQVEHTVETPDDPRPNAFVNSEHGVLRVYHGPSYGNPYGSLYPKRIWSGQAPPPGVPHPMQNPYFNGFNSGQQGPPEMMQPYPAPGYPYAMPGYSVAPPGAAPFIPVVPHASPNMPAVGLSGMPVTNGAEPMDARKLGERLKPYMSPKSVGERFSRGGGASDRAKDKDQGWNSNVHPATPQQGPAGAGSARGGGGNGWGRPPGPAPAHGSDGQRSGGHGRGANDWGAQGSGWGGSNQGGGGGGGGSGDFRWGDSGNNRGRDGSQRGGGGWGSGSNNNGQNSYNNGGGGGGWDNNSQRSNRAGWNGHSNHNNNDGANDRASARGPDSWNMSGGQGGGGGPPGPPGSAAGGGSRDADFGPGGNAVPGAWADPTAAQSTGGAAENW